MQFPNDGWFPIEVSARHVHLSQADQDILFGSGHEMTVKKELSQTQQYAYEETVIVRGPKADLKCRVLGPCRPNTQVEFAFSDGFRTGIYVPMRESGHHEGTPGCTIIGPKGTVQIMQGVIDPQRHLHLSEEEAKAWNLEKNDVISFYVPGPQAAMYYNAVVRTHPTFRLNIHLDTDEGNACSLEMKGGKAKLTRIIRKGETVWEEPASMPMP